MYFYPVVFIRRTVVKHMTNSPKFKKKTCTALKFAISFCTLQTGVTGLFFYTLFPETRKLN